MTDKKQLQLQLQYEIKKEIKQHFMGCGVCDMKEHKISHWTSSGHLRQQEKASTYAIRYGKCASIQSPMSILTSMMTTIDTKN